MCVHMWYSPPLLLQKKILELSTGQKSWSYTQHEVWDNDMAIQSTTLSVSVFGLYLQFVINNILYSVKAMHWHKALTTFMSIPLLKGCSWIYLSCYQYALSCPSFWRTDLYFCSVVNSHTRNWNRKHAPLPPLVPMGTLWQFNRSRSWPMTVISHKAYSVRLSSQEHFIPTIVTLLLTLYHMRYFCQLPCKKILHKENCMSWVEATALLSVHTGNGTRCHCCIQLLTTRQKSNST